LIRYISPFILEHYSNGETSGTFNAFVMNLDLTDYTSICIDLMRQERHGAEEIKLLLETALTFPLEQVRNNGGFIIRYTGDAFFALFPERDPDNVLAAAISIRDYFRKHNIYSTSQGKYPIRICQIVAYGSVFWQVFENKHQNEYAFSTASGSEYPAIARLHKELGFSPQAAEKIGFDRFTREDIAYVPSCKAVSAKPERLEFTYDTAILKRFIQPAMNVHDPASEIRLAACCIVNFGDMERNSQGEVIAQLQQLAQTYGGFVNKILSLDQIRQAMILFGVPRNRGNTLYSACRFVWEVIRIIPASSAGICAGSVFAGQFEVGEISEYTALGTPVNLASRLAGLAEPGQIVVDGSVQDHLSALYSFNYLGKRDIRGVNEPVDCYSMQGLLPEGLASYRGRFVGRKREKSLLKTWLEDTLKNSSRVEITLRGEPGIGKTRLENEVLHSIPDKRLAKISLTGKNSGSTSTEPVRHMLLNLLGLEGLPETDLTQAKIDRLWVAWAGDNTDLQSIKPQIMSLLIKSPPAQLSEGLSPDLVSKEFKHAWSVFLSKIARNRPLVIFADDAHLLDPDSLTCLRAMAEGYRLTRALVLNYDISHPDTKPTHVLNRARHRDLFLCHLELRDVFALYRSLLGMVRISQSARDVIKANTSGNPGMTGSFIFQLIKNSWINSKGEIVLEESAFLQTGVSDMIGLRFEALSGPTKECAFCACVLGHSFKIGVLAEMLHRDPCADLEEGEKGNLWHRKEQDTYTFSHPVIVDNIYGRMVNEKRSMLHLLAAQAIEKIQQKSLTEYATELAWHYQNAGDSENAKRFGDMNIAPPEHT
jgi:class 3 adenylate cyclase